MRDDDPIDTPAFWLGEVNPYRSGPGTGGWTPIAGEGSRPEWLDERDYVGQRELARQLMAAAAAQEPAGATETPDPPRAAPVRPNLRLVHSQAAPEPEGPSLRDRLGPAREALRRYAAGMLAGEVLAKDQERFRRTDPSPHPPLE